MLSALRRAAGQLVRNAEPQSVRYEGLRLPALRLRLGRPHFDDNAVFVGSGRSEARRLVERCGMTSGSTVMEIGCGTGRLPIGILAQIGEVARYIGIDVNARSIAWCKRFITKRHPSFQFVHIDVSNPRYNATGSAKQRDLTLPVADHSVDVIYLYSVFSHLLTDDVEAYVREFARVLAPSGSVFLTGFFEPNVPDVTENPADYGDHAWKGPLHCVRYDQRFFSELVTKYGFIIDRLDHAAETDGQSGVYLRRTARG